MKTLLQRNPFRPKSASFAVYLAVCTAKKGMTIDDVRRKTGLPREKVATLLNSYAGNPFHTAPLQRVGVEICRKDGKFSVRSCKARPNTKRPQRGTTRKIGVEKRKSKTSKRTPKQIAAPKRKPTQENAPQKPQPAGGTLLPVTAAEDCGKVGEN
jgi:hypothetical protein